MPLNRRELAVVDRPNVYLIASTQLDHAALAEFLADEGFPGWATRAVEPGEALVEVAGRVCYMSFAGGRDHPEYIAHLKEARHGSVLEHASITFLLTGVSRSLTHELVRHRAGWAYSQLSQRFVDEEHAQFVEPPLFATITNPELLRQVRDRWTRAVEEVRDTYASLVRTLDLYLTVPAEAGHVAFNARTRKAVRGAARSLLPNATETKIVCTCNARALRHFIEERASPGADAEIRRVALAMYDAALPVWPDILGDYRVARDGDGVPYLTTEHRKV